MGFEFEYYRQTAKQRLSDKKYRHVLAVSEEAVQLARHYGASEEKARAAGLLHDMTKEVNEEGQRKLCERYGIILSEDERCAPKILHAMTGAGFAKEELGVTDEEVLSAVYYHTTARAGMTLLEKIIFLADYVEPLRTFDGVERVRNVVYQDLEKALRIALDATIGEILERGGVLCLTTVQARNHLLLHGEGKK